MTEEKQAWRLDDAAAAYYEKHFVPAIFSDWAGRLVDAVEIAPDDRVLDVACGTGIVARTVAERLGNPVRVTGIDLNASMIKVARGLQPGIDWHEGDVTNLPFAPESFDVVLCQAALMFFPDRVAALREMQQVLRPGGRIAVLTWDESAGYKSTAEIIAEVEGTETAEEFLFPFSLSNPDDVVELFTKAGLHSAKVESHPGVSRFSSIEAFVRTEIDGWVFHGRVDVDALLPLAEDKLVSYCDDDGSIGLPLGGHIVSAVKG